MHWMDSTPFDVGKDGPWCLETYNVADGLTVQCRSAVAVVVVQGGTPREREKVHTAVTRYHITVQLLLIAGMACIDTLFKTTKKTVPFLVVWRGPLD